MEHPVHIEIVLARKDKIRRNFPKSSCRPAILLTAADDVIMRATHLK